MVTPPGRDAFGPGGRVVRSKYGLVVEFKAKRVRLDEWWAEVFGDLVADLEAEA